MSDPINIRALPPGTRIVTGDGAVAEIVANPQDGVWLFARYLESPRDPALVGQEDMIFAQDVVEVRPPGQARAETMAQTGSAANAAQAEFWNSPAARGWADQHSRMDRVLAPLLDALMQTAAPQAGERVLDIGCGSGTTVLELAARVGPAGLVLGADIAEASVAQARRRIAASGLRQADIVHADASAHPFPEAGFDLLFSRLGVMFFADPTAAFANIRRALKSSARVVLGVMRAAAENVWPNGATFAVRHLLPPLPTPGPHEPGPFSWADPARVHRILEGARFRDVVLTPIDWSATLAPPGGAAEAADFMLMFGPLTRIIPTLPVERQQAVRSALESYFRGFDGPQGVALPAANWIVRARA